MSIAPELQKLLDSDPNDLTTGQLNTVKIIVLYNPNLTPDEYHFYKEKFNIGQPQKIMVWHRHF